MNISRGIKRNVKKVVKKSAPAIDLIFALSPVRKASVKAAHILVNRYGNRNLSNNKTGLLNYIGPWKYMLDSPKTYKLAKRKTYVSGWFVPNNVQKVQLRIKLPNNTYQSLNYGIARSDVASTIRTRTNKSVSDNCGFGKTINVLEDGAYYIEAYIEDKWQKVCRLQLEYEPELSVKDVYNGQLSNNYAEHLTLLEAKKKYFYEKESSNKFIFSEGDPRLVAFYLPQFHPIPENDKWWGKGFTEWTNVSAAQPEFIGHEQPKLPADLGYYDLRYPDSIYKQIKLAKDHGIYGFCFYYYWFSGKKLLDTPTKTYLSHPEWDFNFMICWANENWTRRWDGKDEDVLIKQEHSVDDPIKFIKDVEYILTDPRYIKVDGKPVLLVYRAHDLVNPSQYAKEWREYFIKNYQTDLHLVAVKGFKNINPHRYGFDKALDFVPLNFATIFKTPLPTVQIYDKLLDIRFSGLAYDYRKIVLSLKSRKNINRNSYTTVMPSWDNDARKKGGGTAFFNSNPDIYGEWLNNTIKDRRNELIFINAWNEWAEGAYLEPDMLYGHAFLNRTAEIMASYSSRKNSKEEFPIYGIKRNNDTKLAVMIHLYYSDMWPQFLKKLKIIEKTTKFDLFITIPEKSAMVADVIYRYRPDANVLVVPNRGRDVLPFLHFARRLKAAGYEHILKLHSKKSPHRQDGNDWMADLLNKLVPEKNPCLQEILSLLDQKETALIGPEGHFISLDSYFGSNKDNIAKIIDDIAGEKVTDEILSNVPKYGFFAGTMFWARLDSLSPILDMYYQASDFEFEDGQIDGTFAHAIERAISLIPQLSAKRIYMSGSGEITEVSVSTENFNRYKYATNE